MILKSSYHKFTNKTMVITVSILLLLGQTLNVIFPHHLFHVNQILLLSMLLLEFMMIKQIKADTKEFKENIKDSQVLHSFTSRADCSIVS